MYWILSNELENEDADAYLSGSMNIDVGGELSFDLGKAIGEKLPDFIFTTSDDSCPGRMTDQLCIAETTGLVFSANALKILQLAQKPAQFQLFKLTILDTKTNQTHTNYTLVNILGLVDCVDTENSDLKFFDSGNIKRINKLVIDERKIPPEQTIFRLSNRKTLVLVHDSIKQAITNNGLTGFVFYKPEEYQ